MNMICYICDYICKVAQATEQFSKLNGSLLCQETTEALLKRSTSCEF